ncbi:hypothetical protein MKX01_011750 [Papaver californicum]|nr:hypothetical protein MKX01_011750 [Papaver californicum]
MASRIRLPSEYQLLVDTQIISDIDETIYHQIILNVRSEWIRHGRRGDTTEIRDFPEEVIRINPFFSESDIIRSQLEILFSRSEVLNDNNTRGISTEIISREIEDRMTQTTDVSADFRVNVSLYTESIDQEQEEEFQQDFDTQDESYNGIRRNPAPSSEISKLKGFEYVSECGKSGGCIICLEDFIDKEEVIMMRCEHRFHSACLLRWFEENSSCPLCRRSIVQNSNSKESSKQVDED